MRVSVIYTRPSIYFTDYVKTTGEGGGVLKGCKGMCVVDVVEINTEGLVYIYIPFLII